MNSAYLSMHDYRVRLPGSQVGRIVLEHLLTEQDGHVLELAFPGRRSRHRRAGLTEWEGQVDGCLVSVAWDWAELDDGRLQRLPLPVRSNLMLLDERGYDLPSEASDRLLQRLIAGLPWQRELRAALAESAALPPASAPLCVARSQSGWH